MKVLLLLVVLSVSIFADQFHRDYRYYDGDRGSSGNPYRTTPYDDGRSSSNDYVMTPKGTYVPGNEYTITPKGDYVGGNSWTMDPNGDYIGTNR
jgi:hypothetical protein